MREGREDAAAVRSGRPSVDVRTHIGVRFAVVPLSGVAEAMLKTAPVYIYAETSKTVHPAAQKVLLLINTRRVAKL